MNVIPTTAKARRPVSRNGGAISVAQCLCDSAPARSLADRHDSDRSLSTATLAHEWSHHAHPRFTYLHQCFYRVFGVDEDTPYSTTTAFAPMRTTVWQTKQNEKGNNAYPVNEPLPHPCMLSWSQRKRALGLGRLALIWSGPSRRDSRVSETETHPTRAENPRHRPNTPKKYRPHDK
jgi:hypothetical protein